MSVVSRRSFVKKVLAGITALTAEKVLGIAPVSQKDVILTVDKNGNAKLYGAKVSVDYRNNATIK